MERDRHVSFLPLAPCMRGFSCRSAACSATATSRSCRWRLACKASGVGALRAARPRRLVLAAGVLCPCFLVASDKAFRSAAAARAGGLACARPPAPPTHPRRSAHGLRCDVRQAAVRGLSARPAIPGRAFAGARQCHAYSPLSPAMLSGPQGAPTNQPAIHGWLIRGADCLASSAGCAPRPKRRLRRTKTTSHGWRVRSMGPLSDAEHRRADRVLAPDRGSGPGMDPSSRRRGTRRQARTPVCPRSAGNRGAGAPRRRDGVCLGVQGALHKQGPLLGPRQRTEMLCRLQHHQDLANKTTAAGTRRDGRAARSAPTSEASHPKRQRLD